MSDHEPVFKRSKWGSNRYVHNHPGPVGMALIVSMLIGVSVVMVTPATRTGPFTVPDDSYSPPRPTTDNIRYGAPVRPRPASRPCAPPHPANETSLSPNTVTTHRPSPH
ncbi:hypothetical protein [Streptodolium elevatio]|uniref:Uncharacterized protein n=1 Tax=Streptodolium elevatio TaxID=3157996 RepID=A0ABV3DJQ3_9ACTN